VVVVVGVLLIGGCGGGNEASEAATTSTGPVSTTTMSGSTSTSVSVPATSTTTVSTGEPPVIHLAGFTTVYSQDGTLRVSGWLDEPAAVTVGDRSADVLDGQYGGISTFEAVLHLQPGSHAIPVTAKDAHDRETEIILSVLVNPALEMQLALIQEVDLLERTVVADYVEFLIGDEATIAAREDGVIAEGEETPGGFYVRNLDPELRTLTLGDPGMVTLQACFPETGPCVVEQAVEIEAWVELRSHPELAEERVGWAWYGGAVSPYWLTLQDGVVVEVREQYVP
jgi:hypothetical protein